MKFKVGDVVRIVADKSGLMQDSIGRVSVVNSLESGNVDFPYKITDGSGHLITVCCDDELVLADAPQTTFHRSVTFTTDDGIGFTLTGDEVTIAREQVVSVPLSVLIAAINELRKEAK